jgi:hypothetical protein
MTLEQNADQIVVRIRTEMKEWISNRTRQNCRSPNGEINPLLKAQMGQ